MTDDEYLEMGRQLAHPTGEAGLQLADQMHETNIGMTTAAADALAIRDGSIVLELGHGNCGHLEKILQRGQNVKYYGLEISEDMNREAARRNKFRLDSGVAQFDLYDGITIPFASGMFDSIMTVNTIYFWADPGALSEEISRVLKPGGLLAIVFAQKTFMQQLPFTREKFKLVDTDDVTTLLQTAGLNIVRVIDKVEQVKTKTGELVDRQYSLVLASK